VLPFRGSPCEQFYDTITTCRQVFPDVNLEPGHLYHIDEFDLYGKQIIKKNTLCTKLDYRGQN